MVIKGIFAPDFLLHGGLVADGFGVQIKRAKVRKNQHHPRKSTTVRAAFGGDNRRYSKAQTMERSQGFAVPSG